MLQNQNKKGFTLIELLIVVVIIGILAAIAIPKFSSTKEKAYIASMKADLKNLTNVEEAFYADSGKYASKDQLKAGTAYEWNVSQGNAVSAVDGDATGWSAALTNPAVKSVASCNIYAGDVTGAAGTNKGTATADGAPACK
jgi:type IV pilus assembly protein PilA